MTLAEVAARNRMAAGDGLIKATRQSAGAVSFVWTWAYTTRKLGRPPTSGEHAAEWNVSERTIERERHRFRDCFGDAVELQEVADWLNTTAEEMISKRTRVLSLPAPPRLAVA